MDSCEALARDHLLGRGYRDVVYEPDGKVPPDFVLDGRIAVEVRRLNQNERHPTRARGLNVVAGPLLARIQSLCHEHGTANGAAWCVTVRFRRPVPPRARLLAEIRTFLDGVRSRRASRQAVIDTVELRAIPRPDPRGKTFELGVVVDEDAHGPVFGELERNLRLVIHEKSLKIVPVRSRYSEWWLVLVDYVTDGLSREDQAAFQSAVQIAHDWNKIVVVSPLDPSSHFELDARRQELVAPAGVLEDACLGRAAPLGDGYGTGVRAVSPRGASSALRPLRAFVHQPGLA